jgi:hypothetical protein
VNKLFLGLVTLLVVGVFTLLGLFIARTDRATQEARTAAEEARMVTHVACVASSTIQKAEFDRGWQTWVHMSETNDPLFTLFVSRRPAVEVTPPPEYPGYPGGWYAFRAWASEYGWPTGYSSSEDCLPVATVEPTAVRTEAPTAERTAVRTAAPTTSLWPFELWQGLMNQCGSQPWGDIALCAEMLQNMQLRWTVGEAQALLDGTGYFQGVEPKDFWYEGRGGPRY